MTIDRRVLLAGGVAALGLARRTAAAAGPRPIGLQLYTVRDLFARDPVATLEAVARIGYREVEYGGGGYETMDARLLRRTMDRLGLRAPSIHVAYDALLDRFDRTVAMARTLGADTVVLPYLAEAQRSQAGWATTLHTIDRFGARCAAAGLGFAYHNHDVEFVARDGGPTLFDRLVRETNPARVKLELDLYWIAQAGIDPATLIARLGRRIYAYHVKDRRADGGMAAVGAGTIDFARLFRLPGSAGVRHVYVENDRAPAPYLPDITTSFATLRTLWR